MKYIKYLSACMLFPLFFGCQQELKVDGIGSPVQFTVATSYEPETKTEFSGVLTGTSSTVERIDWINGDKFRVNDGGAQSTDLTVASHEDNGVQSVATISGTSLVWEDASATFYALYPAPATGNSAGLATNVATGSIPSVQTVTKDGREYKADMANYGYMCASATASAGSAVSLVFKPLMTAFRFQIYAMEGCAPSANLTSVSLSSASTKLAGDFTATIGSNSAYTASLAGTGSSTVSASLGSGLALSTTEPVTVTLLALPLVQNQLTLTLGFGDNSTRSIDLKEGSNWVSVQPGQKMYVDNLDVPGESRWNYYLGDLGEVELNGHLAVTSGLDFTVTSYRYNTLNPSVNEPVAWTVEYSTDGEDWYSTLAAAGIADRFSVSPTSGNGGVTGDPVHTEITRPHDGDDPDEYSAGNSILADETAAMKLKTIPANAKSSDGYYDLSKHAIYGDSFYGPATTQETANCYVIDRPGKYKFPLTYGNAIRSGATNTIAFAPQGTNGTYNNSDHYMRRFQRHDGYEINNPSVIGQIGTSGASNSTVRIIWQTGTGEILKESDITYNFANSNYIFFEIKEENIRPGNILIGLCYKGTTYLWSWHIWVTNQDMTPTDGFLNQNLGWIYSPTASTEKWADWDFYVKVKQTGTGGLEKIYAVHQIGEGTEAGAERGNSLFYQWGRKDPFPVDWTDCQMYHDHVISTAAASNTNGTIAPNLATLGGMLANHAINQPYTIFVNATTHHWLQGTDANSLIGNLWDATLIPYTSGAESQLPVKSVYDPSPRGFVVPNSGVYSSFSTNDPSEYIANQGWFFGTANGTVFFPLGGGKDEGGTAMTGGYVWSTTSDPHNNATNKHKSQALEFNGSTVTPITHLNKADLLPVRPVVQTKFQ